MQGEQAGTMVNELSGRRVAILAAEGVEQVELVEPRKPVEAAGASTTSCGWTRLR